MAKVYKLAVFDTGKGSTPVIFIHGILSTHRYWNDVIARLPAADYRLITIDLLGYGESPKPKQADYTLEQNLDSLQQSLEALDLQQPAILVGHSLGAIIALKWVTSSPNMFKQLILTSVPYLTAKTLHRQIASLGPKQFSKHHTSAKVLVEAMSMFRIIPPSIARWTFRHLPPHIIKDVTSQHRHIFKKSLRQAIYGEEVLAELSKVHIPTQIIVSQDDPIVGDEGRQALATLARHTAYIHITTVVATHNIPLDKPEIVAAAIMEKL